LEKKNEFWALGSGESCRTQVRPVGSPEECLREFWKVQSPCETQFKEEYGGHPQDIAFLDETEEWRTSREHLHQEDCPCPRNPVLGRSEPGPSTRILTTQKRERAREREGERERNRERERTTTHGVTA
jgi:hypothetical protein